MRGSKQNSSILNLPASIELKIATRLWKFFTLADLAHLKELKNARVLSVNSYNSYRRWILKYIGIEIGEHRLSSDIGDVYKNREAILKKNALGFEIAGYLALARARREANTVAFQLGLRASWIDLLSEITTLNKALCLRSKSFFNVQMADMTYLQPAVPTSLAHYILSFSSQIDRCSRLLFDLYREVNMFPGGVGSTNGTLIPISRQRIAKSLAFSGSIENCRNAVWPTETYTVMYGCLASISLVLNRLCHDLIVFNSEPFSFLRLKSEHTRKSVIMPNKKNPYHLSYVRGFLGEVVGKLNSHIVQNATNTLQVDNRIFAYFDLHETIEGLIDAVKLLESVFSGIEFDELRLKKSAQNSYILSTDLAESIVLHTGINYLRVHSAISSAIESEKFRTIDQNFANQILRDLEYSGAQIKIKDVIRNSQQKQQTGSNSRQALNGSIKTYLKNVSRLSKNIKQIQNHTKKVEGKLLRSNE